MKKIAIIFSLFALLVGCEQVSDLDQIGQNNSEIENSGTLSGILPATLTASVEAEEDTRVFVDEDKVRVLWHNGDAVSYFGNVQNAKYVYNGEDGAEVAVMELASEGTEGAIEGLVSYAIYPYSEDMTISEADFGYKFNIVYPSTQTYTKGSFSKGSNVMTAIKDNEIDDDSYHFLHANSFLVLKLYGEDVNVKTITLSALNSDVKLSGNAYVVARIGGTPGLKMGGDNTSSTVTLECGDGVALGTTKEEATEFWFALPPVKIDGGFKIEVLSTDHRTFEMQTTKSITIERAKVQPMAALKFESNTAGSYQLFYTTSDGQKIDFSHLDYWSVDEPFNTPIVSHTYENGQGVITLNEPLTHINYRAFYNKSTLTSITLPKSLVEIGACAFRDTSLTEVTLPGSLKHIGTEAFLSTEISSFILPESLETIGRGAFCATPITSITIPGSVTEIHEEAFKSCNNLTTIEFKPSPTGSTLTFYYASTSNTYQAPFYHLPLKTVILNREMVVKVGDVIYIGTGLGNGIFATNKTLTEVRLGEQVKTITNNMFERAQFTSLTIPGTVTNIGEDAFSMCDKLTSVTFESGTEDLQIKNLDDDLTGEWSPFRETKLETLVLDRNLVPSYTIDQDDDGLFSEIETLKNVTLGPNVKTIGDYMFLGTGITSINIPDSVTSIGTYAFYDCTSLKNVTLGNGMKTIGLCAFRNTPITSITIPASVTKIYEYAFLDCKSLSSVRFESSSDNITIYSQYHPTFAESPLSSVYLDREVIYLNQNGNAFEPTKGQGLFNKNNALNVPMSITLGPNVKTIHNYMFAELNIQSLDLGSGVTSIGRGAFSYTSITSLTIPANVTFIDDFAFDLCTALSSITFEESDTDLTIGFQDSIDETGPFYDSPLSTINLYRNLVLTQQYAESQDAWDEGLFACSSSAETVSVTLGNQVKNISDYMFSYLNIKGITIPSSVKSIGVEAFRDTPITSITIPGSVNEIGVDAFYNCESLSTVTFEASPTETPLKIGQGFSSVGWDLGPFYYSPLKTINLNRELQYVDEDGNNFVADTWDEGVFTNFKYEDEYFSTSINIGEQVKTILPYMFSCTRVKYIWIPKTVTSIGERAFYYCLAFQGLSCNHTTPPTLGDDAFEDCDAMWYIKVPAESMWKFKSANNWSDYDKNNKYNENFYYTL